MQGRDASHLESRSSMTSNFRARSEKVARKWSQIPSKCASHRQCTDLMLPGCCQKPCWPARKPALWWPLCEHQLPHQTADLKVLTADRQQLTAFVRHAGVWTFMVIVRDWTINLSDAISIANRCDWLADIAQGSCSEHALPVRVMHARNAASHMLCLST